MLIDGNCASEVRAWFNASTSPLIAIFGVWIALQQYRLKKYTLLKDVFDKRLTVFAAAKKLIQRSLQSQQSKNEALDEFDQKVAGASFLFNADITAYLEELRKNFCRILEISEQQEDNDFNDDNERDQLLAERRKLKKWMRDEVPTMESRFKKYFNLTDA